jgi:hypothetical protein
MMKAVRGARSDSTPRTDWFLAIVLCVLTTILVLQRTKQALLPAKQTPVLWLAELVTIAGVIVLRSGWARDSGWLDEQARLGTLANNFYEPRRDALINGFAIGVGVFGALWWGMATWGVLFTGMRRGVPTRGLVDFLVAGIAGAITGGVLGAVLGLVIGHIWETRHRRNRLAQRVTHA